MIFDDFIKTHLIELGGNDDIYNKLIKSAEDLMKALKDQKKKIINYTLVTLSNNINETEPVLIEVEKAVTENWKMLRSQFPMMPINLYKGIILQSLEHLVNEHTDIATIIWLTGKNLFPHIKLKKKEKKLLSDFLYKMGNIAEKDALTEWNIDSLLNIKSTDYESKLSKLNLKIDIKELTQYLIKASGPHGNDGKIIENANQHWPNNGDRWSYEFAPLAADGIAVVINKALKTQNDILNNYLSLFAKFSTLDTVERRSQIIWWKETLYSKRLKKSYRELSSIFETSIAMAFDLYDILPNRKPASIDCIL